MKIHLCYLLALGLFIVPALKSKAQWSTSGTNIYNSNAGNVGVGTSSPVAKFHVSGGILSTGNGATPVSGSGTRFMWIPNKYALRAGTVSGSQWDNADIGTLSVAFGQDTKASGYSSFAHGMGATASGFSSFAFGWGGTIASGQTSIALGQNAQATNASSVSLGANTLATGTGSTALGVNTTASNNYSFACGIATQASGRQSTAMGNQTIALGDNSFAAGFKTQANGYASTATGDNTIASGSYSFATGLESQATGHYSFATGNSTKALGYAAVAMGGSSQATSDHSIALGTAALALGYSTTSIGSWATAQGSHSKAIGYYVTAQSDYSMTIGTGSLAFLSPLVNTIDNSLMIGFNSNLPTLFVGPAATIDTFGKVGIGTTTPQSELAVNGTITAKALNLTMTGWPDYVFANEYKHISLDETEKYIVEHKHLPGVPSAEEIETNGLNVGNMSKIMMEKIEEITLHLIEIKKENDGIKKENRELRKTLHKLTNNN